MCEIRLCGRSVVMHCERHINRDQEHFGRKTVGSCLEGLNPLELIQFVKYLHKLKSGNPH
jgi:hypothetical protein